MTNTEQDPTLQGLEILELIAGLWHRSYNPQSLSVDHHRQLFRALDDIERRSLRVRASAVKTMRAEGRTWQEIGDALGTSRQAAQMRFS